MKERKEGVWLAADVLYVLFRYSEYSLRSHLYVAVQDPALRSQFRRVREIIVDLLCVITHMHSQSFLTAYLFRVA